MKLNLEDLINKGKSKSCLILGPGETMSEFPFKKFKGKIIVIGNAGIRCRDKCIPDYWVVSNNHFPVPYVSSHRKIINQFRKTIFLFSESTLHDRLWKKSVYILKKKLKVKWIFFDERHFNYNKCTPENKCCKYIKKNKECSTIQELVNKVYKHGKRAELAGSVFEFALALALILGFSKIYIQGVDLPTKTARNINEKKINDGSFGQLGYKYDARINPKILEEIKQIYVDLEKIITKQSSKVFLEDNNIFYYLIYSIVKKIKKIFLNTRYPFFKDDIALILRNIRLYANIAKKNKIKIYSLSKKSNLNKVKNITFLKRIKFSL